VIKPVVVICTTLSFIWDFQVFSQLYVMMGTRPSKDYYTMSIYAYVESFDVSDYGRRAAIAVVMILLMLAGTVAYIRQMLRLGEVP